jgi:hypothetical protein
MYLFDDPTINTRKLWRSVWFKMHCQHVAIDQRYGQRPEWRDWIRRHGRERDDWQSFLGISGADRGQAQRLASREWPTPRKMLDLVTCGKRKSFFEYFDAWFYGRLSQSIHFTGEGFLLQAAHRLFEDPQFRMKYQSNCLAISQAIYLCLLSELAVDLTQGGHTIEMLTGVWERFGKVFGFGKELWQERYADLFDEFS